MASVPVLFLLLSAFLLPIVAKAGQNNSNLIPLGSKISPNANHTPWLSPSGLFAFGFYPQGGGFAIGIWLVSQPENTITWTANRDDPPVSSNATLHLTTDGKLLVRTDHQGGEKSIFDYVDEDDQPAASAAMLDSGNFVLYNNESEVIWESFAIPTDTILGGQNLYYYGPTDHLVSSVSTSDHSSGRYSLYMHEDGNLGAYLVNSSYEPNDAYWSSNTAASGYGVRLSLSSMGVLCLVNGNQTVSTLAYSSYRGNSKTIIHRATLDADGNFRLYLHHFGNDNSSSTSIEWSALTKQCDVKGSCGFNSYCSGMGTQAECNCYPGFNLINPRNKFLGCYENETFSEDGCRSGVDPAMLYHIASLENMWLADYPYSEGTMMKEECGNSCLEDCDCGVALFTGDHCSKYKLPITYGKISINESAIAFFKVVGIPYHTPPKVLPYQSKRSLILILALSLGSISCLCLIFAIYNFFIYRHQVYRYTKLSKNANLGLTEDFTLRSFSYSELDRATDGFKEELGRGSFGAVYKGTVSGSNKTIAVKRLEKAVEEGEREFRAEMTAIARTHHRNLVRFLGFCIEGARKLLVYEYMSNGSLAHLLFKTEMRPIWKERVRIALDVARGILYLHEECEVRIIHCNIKPQNILLDDTWTAKISDFGFAKLLVPNQSRTTMGADGTSEYLAPEWHKNALMSVKSDIYSLGIVLLEIVCCRRSIEVNVSTEDEIILSSWIYSCFVAGELDKLVEDENVDFKTLERMVKVGLWCIQEDPALRPLMKNVILMLEGTLNVPVPPSPASHAP